jgi:hypothetical protein
MIKHVVMWSFQDEALGNSKEENKQHAKKILLDLVGIVPSIHSLEVGLKEALSPLDNQDVVLVSEFKTWADLQAYVVHPEHQKVGAFIKAVASSRAAVDYEF